MPPDPSKKLGKERFREEEGQVEDCDPSPVVARGAIQAACPLPPLLPLSLIPIRGSGNKVFWWSLVVALIASDQPNL